MKIESHKIIFGLILALAIALFLRILLTLIGYNLAQLFYPFPLSIQEMALTEFIPTDQSNPWYFIAQPFHRFDALWYEAVAKTQYVNLPLAANFYPLYPLWVTFFSSLFGLPFYIGAYFINTFLTASTLFLFYLMILQATANQKLALKTIILFSFFPTAFFLLAPYAEPVLLSLFFLSLILGKKKYYLASSIVGMLAAATKPYGFIIFIPLVSQFLSQANFQKKLTTISLYLLIPLGSLSVLLFQSVRLNQPLIDLVFGSQVWRKPVNTIIHILDSVSIAVANPFNLVNDLNLFLTLVTIFFLFYSFSKIPIGDWLFTLALFLIVMSFGSERMPLMSFSRHFLSFYPIYVFAAKAKVSQVLIYLYVAGSSTMMVFFFIYYTFGFFVA